MATALPAAERRASRRRTFRPARAQRAAAALLDRGARRRHALSVGPDRHRRRTASCRDGSKARPSRRWTISARSLKGAASASSDVFKCTVMLADMKNWPAFNKVYVTYFPDGKLPARSAFGANGLALGA